MAVRIISENAFLETTKATSCANEAAFVVYGY